MLTVSPRSTRRRLLLPLLLAVAALPAAADPALSPREILDHVDDLMRGDSAHGRATMTIRTEHWQRSLTMELWSEGTERSLIRILAPTKEKGTATLKSGTEIWNYLPKVKRVIKLPSSMMSSSWMGSHFTNDDLVKESRMAEDYAFEVTFEGERDGVELIEITCVPHEDAVVVWGKVVVRVHRKGWMPIAVDYFDEDLELARTLSYSDPGELGGRMLPRRMEVVPADEPEESTIVIYEQLDFDIELADNFFSQRNLRR